MDYDKNEVDYYSYKYPAADKLLVGGRMVHNSVDETYRFLIPSATILYMANLTWTAYLYDRDKYRVASGGIKMDYEYVFNKSTTANYFGGVYEYARYYRDIADMARDTRHTIYITSYVATLKSAVVILYQSG
ncbi:MAG: hypothetical protein C5S48_03130 [Candidatus Methanogaster sp.]|nr:MAG: hypothetical protein C5S48_03130 [ANME-2 cluster archaeon]